MKGCKSEEARKACFKILKVLDPMFKDNLDLKYQAHSEKLKRHKALHILNPDERFSGSYKCKVSSFIDEASAENEVIVYVPPNHAELTPLNGEDNKPSNVSCVAYGVFPLPNINLVWTENSTIFSSTELNFKPNLANPGLFDVSVTASVDPLEVFPHDMLSCNIALPGTLFVMQLESVLLKGNGEKIS